MRLVEGWPPIPRLVALGRLDLDHVGAMVGQDHGAIGTAEDPGQVHDFQPGEGSAALGIVSSPG